MALTICTLHVIERIRKKQTYKRFGPNLERDEAFSISEFHFKREEGSGWGTHVYLWRIHFDIWQN